MTDRNASGAASANQGHLGRRGNAAAGWTGDASATSASSDPDTPMTAHASGQVPAAEPGGATATYGETSTAGHGEPLDHFLTASSIASLRFTEGLVPVIAQDHVTGEVLMLAWANEEALRLSLQSGWMTYWSRSRREIWQKGATSGHRQRLVSLHADCDRDAVLAIVEQDGPACHTGTATCWSEAQRHEMAGFLGALEGMARQRQAHPQDRYTDHLLADAQLAAAKIEEEAAELGAVLRGQDNDDTLEHEAADLLYHLIVALRGAGVDLLDVMRELRGRES